MRKVSRMLIPLTEARGLIDRAGFPSLTSVETPVTRSMGRLAAKTVRARMDLPPRRVSAMDGYALHVGSKPTLGPVIVLGEAFPASPPTRRTLRLGEASYIATGSFLPPGANAIVRIESTRREGDRLWLKRPANRGQDILEPGEAMEKDDLIVERGQLIAPVHVGALVAQRVKAIPTVRVRASIVPIGDELATVDSSPTEGVPDIIGPTLASLLGFAEVELLPPVRDDPLAVARALTKASRHAELIFTIGGSSVGTRDVTKAAVRNIGTLLFEGVTTNVLKRGAVGLISGKPVVVLPGQLVSAITVFHEHGLHVLSRLVGRELRCTEEVRLGTDIEVDHRMDSTFLFSLSSGVATPLPWGVARMAALLRSQAFGVLSHGRRYRAGTRLRVSRLWCLN
jgi:molybdopterin molybdotransferase